MSIYCWEDDDDDDGDDDDDELLFLVSCTLGTWQRSMILSCPSVRSCARQLEVAPVRV